MNHLQPAIAGRGKQSGRAFTDEDGTAPAPRASWPTTWNEFLADIDADHGVAVLGV